MEWYMLHQPRKLISIAMEKLGLYIALQVKHLLLTFSETSQCDAIKAEVLLSHHIDIIRNNLDCNLSIRILHDELLDLIVRDLKQMQLTQNKHEKLSLASLCSNSHMLIGLVRLCVTCRDPNINETMIMKMFRELRNLKKIRLKYFNNNILRCITENCVLIEELDLSSTYNCINDDNIHLITNLSNLKKINLEDTSVTQKGIEILLIDCVNIEHIRGSHFLAGALEKIVSSKDNKGKLFKLKSFENDHETTLKQLQLLVESCPLMEDITFDNTPRRRIPGVICILPNDREATRHRYNLKVLNALRNLQRLTLRNYLFYEDKVKQVLQVKGHSLKRLYLELYNVDIKALQYIIQTCPNLQSLWIDITHNYEEKNAWTNLKETLKRIQNFAQSLFEKESSKANLTLLKTLHLEFRNRHPMDDQLIIFLLSSCPNVEFIYTDYGISLTDDVMFAVMNKNPLTCLKELKMWQTQLTTQFVERIIRNSCNPQIIVRLPQHYNQFTSDVGKQ